ncbi:MAG: MucBP domain-containing protein, partial [Clostridium sp.]|nr:MucBP domain-containing protein [Clostridium sp.]
DAPVIKSIKPSKAAPQTKGSSVVFTVNAIGGENVGNGLLFYKFFVTAPNGKEEIVQYYSRKNTYTLIGKQTGTYKIRVEVQNADNTTVSKEMEYEFSDSTIIIPTELTLNSFAPTKSSPQTLGTSIVLSADAEGGTGSLTYKYYVKLNGTTTTLKTSTANTYTWKPTEVGTYTVYVDVTDEDGNKVSKNFSYVISNGGDDEDYGTVIVKYLDEETGEEITSSTTLTGKVGEAYKATAKTISGYTLSFTPANASGNYTLATKTVLYYYIKSSSSSPVISSFTASKQSPQVTGTQVTLTAKATGTGTLQYKFLIQDANGNWGMLRDYGTTNSIVWKTGKTGTKILYVDVKDSNGKVTRKSMSYTVKEAQTAPVISSFTASKQSPQVSGTQVTLTAKATGTGTLKYKFLIQDASGNWGMLRDYGTSNTIVWITKATGTKTLYVDVKDSNGKVTRKSMSYTVKAEEKAPVISSFIASKQSPQVSGTQVTLAATAIGTGTLKYKFLIKDAKGNWGMLRDYGITNAIIWKTGKTGSKTLYVDVKDSNGKVTRKSMTYVIK